MHTKQNIKYYSYQRYVHITEVYFIYSITYLQIRITEGSNVLIYHHNFPGYTCMYFSLTAGNRRVEWHDLRCHLRRFGGLLRRLFAGVALLHGEKQRTGLVVASRLEIRISFLSLLSPRFVVPWKPPREMKLELELTF